MTWLRPTMNISYSEKSVVIDSIVNAFWYFYMASTRLTLFAFHKVQWLDFTGEVDIFIVIWCDVSSGFRLPKITKIGSLCTELLHHVRREWALLSFHSVCLSGCLSVIPRPTAYHDWSITTKFGRQVYTCLWTRVSLFGSPISHTFGARGKTMQNFAYFQANVTHRAIWLVFFQSSLFLKHGVV